MTEKTTVKKTTGRKKIIDKIEEELSTVAEEAVKTKTAPKKEEVKTLKDEDKILIMNNTTGRYGYASNTGYSLTLEEYGDRYEIPFGELRKMASSKAKSHIKEAMIVILDEQAIEELNLIKEYEYIFDDKDVNRLLKKPELLKEVLPKVNRLMKEAIIVQARSKFASGELFDNRIAQVIKEVANKDVLS